VNHVEYEEYLQPIEQAELLEDIRDFDAISEAIERGDEELIPAEVVNAILDSKNPVKVGREYQGLTQQQLGFPTPSPPFWQSQSCHR
jgi:hypothetical protein